MTGGGGGGGNGFGGAGRQGFSHSAHIWQDVVAAAVGTFQCKMRRWRKRVESDLIATFIALLEFAIFSKLWTVFVQLQRRIKDSAGLVNKLARRRGGKASACIDDRTICRCYYLLRTVLIIKPKYRSWPISSTILLRAYPCCFLFLATNLKRIQGSIELPHAIFQNNV